MLSEEQIERYSRQIILPQVGGRGQEKLLSASVAVLGAGGMGCAAAVYLAAAGIGRLQLIGTGDRAALDLAESLLGGPADRADTAAAALGKVNPDCTVTAVSPPVTSAIAGAAVRNHDIILTAGASRDTCTLVNAACLTHRKPLLWGSVAGFQGRFALLAGAQAATPCYGCLQDAVADAPPSDGVFGPSAAWIGTLQALVAIELILGLEVGSREGMVVYDALDLSVQQMTIAKDPHCGACGGT